MGNVLDELIDRKIKAILTVILGDKEGLFHLQKISKMSKVPIASSFRILRKLVDSNIVEVIKIDKFKVYRLANNKKTKALVNIWENGR